jgi:hypothetical protein
MCFAVDNRRLVPPFFPFGRNADELFAAMIVLLDPGALIMHAPLLVRHDPPEKREYANTDVAEVDHSTVDIVIAALYAHVAATPAAGSLKDGLLRFGIYLRDVAGFDEKDFLEWLRFVWSQYVARVVDRLDDTLANTDIRTPWLADDLKRLRGGFVGTLQTWRDAIPREFRARDSSSSDPELPGLREALGRYGASLRVWPDAHDRAVQHHRAQ